MADYDGKESWLFYKQKSWPSSDGIFEPAIKFSEEYSAAGAALFLRKYADLTDPHTHATYDAIKSGSAPCTTALSAELLPTCDDYVPSKL